MLDSQKPYLDKTGLGFEKGDDEQSSKDSPNQIPNTLMKYASLGEKPNRKGKGSKTLLTQKDPRRYGYLKLKLPLMQVCLKSIHQREKKWYLDSGCSRHMTGNKSWFRNLRPKDSRIVKFADGIKSKFIGIGNVGKQFQPNN